MNDPLYWTDHDGTAHERCCLIFSSTGEMVDGFDPGAHPELRWPRGGWAMYCPYCAEIWDRIIMLDSRGRMLPLTCISVACAKHPDLWNIPGSVLAGELEGLLPLLPPQLTQREFKVHLQHEEGQREHGRTDNAGYDTQNAEPQRREGTA